MIPLETQIFRLIFPPSGSIPLEKLEAVPTIRQHINSIIDLANTEHGIATPSESAALTARVIELRDTPGPDGKIRTWRTIAEICGTTLDAVRHRYNKGKATIRKSRIVEEVTPEEDRFVGLLTEPVDPIQAINGAFVTVREMCENIRMGHVEPTVGGIVASEPIHPCAGGEGEYTKISSAVKLPNDIDRAEWKLNAQKTAPIPTRLTMCGDFTTIHRVDLAGKPVDVVGVGVLGEPSGPQTVVESSPSDPETLTEVDRMLGEGMTVKEISAELEKNKKHVPWTKIRARAAYLAKMKRKEAKPESQEVEATDDRSEPVAISRKELDLRIWDMWRAGKTLDEISEILCSEGLYYSAKSVRVRLLSQGAKL